MSDTCTLTLPITGMTCASCVARVEKAVARVPGVRASSVNLATEQATVSLAPASAAGTALALAEAVQRAGYGLVEQTRDLQIDGMSCASCVGRVEAALRRVPGVLGASVNLASNSARVRRLAGSASDAALQAALQQAGYGAKVREDGQAAPATVNRDPGWKVALAAALSAPLVLPMAGDLLGRHWMLPALWQWLLARPVLAWLGARFFVAGWKARHPGARHAGAAAPTWPCRAPA